jgi:DNA-binding CsgD family transcriptional regulator
MGKTTLLDACADAAVASGCRVLRGAGVQFGSKPGFYGLTQLLSPLATEFSQLSELHRDALAVALGVSDRAAADRLVLFNAVLAVLRAAGAARPVIVIIDDLPWLDRASATVLAFAARRLSGSRVGVLTAARPGEHDLWGGGLPVHELGPLSDEAAAELVDLRFPGLPAHVRARVLAVGGGNPLALAELPASLSQSPGQRYAAPHLSPDVLPLSRRLQELFAARIFGLPRVTRQLLLTAALNGRGDVGLVRVAVDGSPSLADLAAAERAHLVQVLDSTGRMAFAHPLIRSAIVQLSPAEERRKAHCALAEQLGDQPERQAWHLAEAAAGPDEQLAIRLESVARKILQRGDAVGAVAALLRSADLSPAGPGRSHRLAWAAYLGAGITGEPGNAPDLLAEAQRAADTGASLYAAVATAFLMLNEGGTVETAHRLLAGTLEAQDDPGDAGNPAIVEAVLALLLVSLLGARLDLWESFHAALGRLRHPPEEVYLASLAGSDPARLSPAVLMAIDRAVAGISEEIDHFRILMISSAALPVDRLAGCRDPLWRIVRARREGGGAITPAIEALGFLVADDWLTGRWDEAQELADEAGELCAGGGGAFQSGKIRHYQAMLAAARGDADLARHLMADMTGWAAPRGVGHAAMAAHHVGCLIALSREDYEAAYQHAAAISPAGAFASHVPLALWVPMSLVEAAVRTGRLAEAAAHVTAMRETSIAALSPRLALAVAGAEAIASPPDQMDELFQAALAIGDASHWPFEQARIQLCYGEYLRRGRDVGGARRQLGTALDTFRRLGAQPWAARAARELRASGRLSQAEPVSALTEQELEIARLAAAGLSNKQIGERLLLSHRTVAAYLHRIFPKLGISARAALRGALAELDAAPAQSAAPAAGDGSHR